MIFTIYSKDCKRPRLGVRAAVRDPCLGVGVGVGVVCVCVWSSSQFQQSTVTWK